MCIYLVACQSSGYLLYIPCNRICNQSSCVIHVVINVTVSVKTLHVSIFYIHSVTQTVVNSQQINQSLNALQRTTVQNLVLLQATIRKLWDLKHLKMGQDLNVHN